LSNGKTAGDLTANPFIVVRDLTYRYRREDRRPALKNVDLEIDRGDYLLIAGRSGSGKSTLCRTLNGLIPHFYGGVLEGDVFVDGEPVRSNSVAALFNRVAMVFQNPDAQLFCRSVEQEIVFGLESLGLPRQAIEARLNAAMDQTGIGSMRHRDPQTLSGGEKHLVLITALLAMRPRIIVLDEPFANLDPANARRVRKLLCCLHAQGYGIVLCEHRLSRAAVDATRMAVVHQGRVVADGRPHHILAHADPEWALESPLAVRVGAALNLKPLPCTLADLEDVPPHPELIERLEPPAPLSAVDRQRPAMVEVEGLECRVDGRAILSDIHFRLHAGECLAIVGANGAGKTTLLRHLIGLQRPTKGRILMHGADIARTPIHGLAREVGLSFQNPDNQFFKFTVDQEIRVGPETLHRLDTAWLEELIDIFRLEPLRFKAPYRLSGGEKKRVAFASALASRPAVLALDEPTAGQDFEFRRSLRDLLGRMQAGGQAILIVTHDLTFAERSAGRWLLMAGGRLLADAAPHRIMADAALMDRAGLEPTDRFRLMQRWQSGQSHA
jgi:energy-coupling factor transport system ATP-binding protein